LPRFKIKTGRKVRTPARASLWLWVVDNIHRGKP